MDWLAFLTQITTDILAMQWSHMAAGYMAGGLEEEFNVPQVRRQMKYYENLDLLLQCSMLQTTCVGGVWTRYMLYMEGLTEDSFCPRCAHKGAHVETDYHRYWECPDTQSITHPDVQATQPMQNQLSEMDAEI